MTEMNSTVTSTLVRACACGQDTGNVKFARCPVCQAVWVKEREEAKAAKTSVPAPKPAPKPAPATRVHHCATRGCTRTPAKPFHRWCAVCFKAQSDEVAVAWAKRYDELSRLTGGRLSNEALVARVNAEFALRKPSLRSRREDAPAKPPAPKPVPKTPAKSEAHKDKAA